MSKQVGYLTNYQDGLSGERGFFYDYIFASNGLFIEAESPRITARIRIADVEIRGLAPIETKVSLLYGSIPQRFFDLALDLFLTDIGTEHYAAVTADAGYHFYIPVQDKAAASVVYQTGTNVVLEMHSHGQMGARFSPTDNTDEAGMKIYCVIGRLDATPILKLRVGVYGYFQKLSWRDVFDGSLQGALEDEPKEVITESGVHDFIESDARGLKNIGRRLWGHWGFRR